MGKLTLDIPRDRNTTFDGFQLPPLSCLLPHRSADSVASPSTNEGAKFWLSVLTNMKNRGPQDIFVACIDGLTGFADAIHTAYPDTKVQLCVVHLVRAALRYATDKDCRAVAADLKKIYNAPTLTEAEQALEEFAQAWDDKYPTIAKSWRQKWPDIITLF